MITNEKMKLILQNSKHTQEWLAGKLGVSQAYISKKFKKGDWRESEIRLFCEAFGIDYIISFDDKNGNNLI